MAFTSEQLILEAKNRIGENSIISDRTLQDFFSNPMFKPQADADPDDDYWNRTIETLKWFDKNYTGQHNHAMSEAHAIWEEQYRKEHPAQEPPVKSKPEERKPEQQTVTTEDIARIVAEAIAKNQPKTDPAVEQLQKQMKEWQERHDKEEEEAIIKDIYSKARANITNGVEVDSACFEDTIEIVQTRGLIKKDTSLADAEKLIREQYEKRYARHNPGGSTPYGINVGGGGGGESYAMKFHKAHADAAAAQRKIVEEQRSRFK